MAIDLNAATTSFPGFKTRWGIDEYLFAAQGNDLEHSRKADKIEASGFGTRVKNNLPGMQEGNLKIKGMAAMSRGQLNYVLNQRFGRNSPVMAWYALQGLTALSPITCQPSSITDSSISAKIKDAVDFSLELDARGAYDDGFILLSPYTLLSGASGTGPSDNNSVASGGTGPTTSGGAAYLFVWAIDGGTSPTFTPKIQHSTDGSTWTDLTGGGFSAVSAPGAQRIVIPTGVTINQQVQVSWAASGTPTAIQCMLAFARGVNLDA